MQVGHMLLLRYRYFDDGTAAIPVGDFQRTFAYHFEPLPDILKCSVRLIIILLTKTGTVTSDDGTETVDHTEVYDIESINDLLDEYYGTQEPSQDEPSQQASIIVPGTETFRTGDSSAAWGVALVMILAAGTAFVTLRKKEKSE